MSSTKPIPRKSAVSAAKTGRRHRSDDEKLKIGQESFEDGMVQAQLAQRHGIWTSQLWDWRARYKAGLFKERTEFFSSCGGTRGAGGRSGSGEVRRCMPRSGG